MRYRGSIPRWGRVPTFSWGIVGTLFSLNVVGSSWAEIRPVSEDLLRFSRFPQGLPEGYGR